MANDPNTIQYVIQEDGFWYIASKEKNPYVPELTVSAKGIANGLSTEYNDGFDFGPDSYNPSVTSGVPLTQTSGIQEAWNYCISNATLDYEKNGWIVPVILILAGNCVCDTDVNINTNSLPLTNISIQGVDRKLSKVTFTSSTHRGFIIDPSYTDDVYMGKFEISSNGGTGGLSSVEYLPTSFHGNDFHFFEMYFGDTVSNGNIYISQLAQLIIIDVFFNAQSPNVGVNITSSVFTAIILGGSIASDMNYAGNSVSILSSKSVAAVTTFIGGILHILGGEYYAEIKLSGNAESISIDNVYMDYLNYPNLISLKSGVASATVDNVVLNNVTFNSNISNNITVVGSGITVKNAYTRQIVNSSSYTITLPYNTPTLSTNPPASATVYQNTNPYDIEIDLPVYATTAGTAGYVTVAKGASSTPTAIGNQYVSGDTSDTSEQIIRLRVPAGWYYEFTASGVTFGTASVFAD